MIYVLKPILTVLLSFTFILTLAYGAEDYPEIPWDVLKHLNDKTGEYTERIEALLDKPVKIAGFIVPLELDGYIGDVKEFLLVPDPMACLHMPPPPPNQIIYVTMNKAIPFDIDFRGVYISGNLELATPDKMGEKSSMVQSNMIGFYIKGIRAEEADLEIKDPWFEILGPY